LINADSMVVVFKSMITFSTRAVFCFGTISCMADVEGTLHRIATSPERKSPLRSTKGEIGQTKGSLDSTKHKSDQQKH
jgi:hypothetical protein